MKKLLLVLLALPFIGFGQNVNIPDANFKGYLLGNTAINTNGDTEIQVTEATAFNGTIDCWGMGISNLTGIEAFTALTYLDCSLNQLKRLDISANTSLNKLGCSYNQLNSLDVSQNTALTELYCWNNQLDSLNVSQNTALIGLYCYSNQLTSLDVRNGNNTNFIGFVDANGNAIPAFNASNNPNLYCINVDDATWSTANWTVIDPQSFFSNNCGSK
jgi:Leucine-rich repeat (LRR) protein